jgi:hypothetical protein
MDLIIVFGVVFAVGFAAGVAVGYGVRERESRMRRLRYKRNKLEERAPERSELEKNLGPE